jgi:uncharacterized protein (TIGR02271 family)
MDRHDEQNIDRDRAQDLDTSSSTVGDGETHATTGGAAAAGAVTGGVIGLAGGPVGAAIGAVGGAIVGAAAERMMHSDDDAERARAGLGNDRDRNPFIEDRAEATTTDAPNAATTDLAAARLDTGAPNASLSDTSFGTASRSAELNAPENVASNTASTTAEGGTLRLREEELQARKTPVETGQVSIGKEVVEEQRTLDVPVTREEAFVERHPVDRQPSDKPIGEGRQEVEVPIREERVSMEKRPVDYEEVGIGKREVTDTQQVSGTVRREEARIEREGEANIERPDQQP